MKSSIGLYLQAIVKDKNGKIVKDTGLLRSKSFVLQFLQIIEVQMFHLAAMNIRDTANTLRSCVADDEALQMNAGVGIATFGIFVGTGSTSPASDDYAPETQIAHGVGAGQLSYGASSRTTTAEVGANVDFIATRTFNNGSGATINVTEFGMIMNAGLNGGYDMLTIHDVIAAVQVLNGQTLTVNYTFRTTV